MAIPKSSKPARKRAGSSNDSGFKARRQFNQAQAEARRERSHGAGPRNIADVYDYAVEQVGAGDKGKGKGRSDRIERRAKAGLHGGRGKRRQDDDEDEDITDEANEEDQEEEAVVGPVVFENSDDELANQIEGSDEDIDSDEAFGDSDNERFGGWKFAGARNKAGKGKGKFDDSDASDDGEEDEEEEDGHDMMDISRMLDADSSEDGSDEEESGDDERLQRHLQSMTSKRTADGEPEPSEDAPAPAAKRTRRLLSDRTEAMQEGEWAATNASGVGNSKANLRVEDLLDALSGQAGLSSLRNSARALTTSQRDGGDIERRPVASRKGGGALSAPLPTVVQDRLNRQAAYSATKDEVEGWAPTIKRLREAEHLSFPLQVEPAQRVTNASLASSFRPANALEHEIADMLAAEGMTEKQLAAQEELEMKELDPEEVKRRREELRRMRELLFRAEQKSKRVSKIKSKAYRKVARKEKERERAKLEEAGLLNADPEEEAEYAIKAERLRARERATLKHKNTSKWAKHALGRKEQSSETRGAIEEQLRRGEQLRRKIHGLGSDEDEDDVDDSDGDVSGEDAPHARAFDELDALERRDAAQRAEDAASSSTGKHKSVMNMKFMKDARDRDARAAQHDADELRRDLAKMEAQANGDDDGDELNDLPAGSVRPVDGNEGRAMYGSGVITTSQLAPTSAKPAEKASQLASAPKEKAIVELLSATDTRTKPAKQPAQTQVTDELVSNPWLAVEGSTSKLSRKENTVAVGRSSHDATKAKNRADKAKSKGDDARQEREEDARVEIDTGAGPRGSLKQASKNGQNGIVPFAPDASSDEDSDGVEQPVLMKHRRSDAIRQRALVAEAFAGDDVAAEFAEAKRAIVEEDAPREEDNTLPGWGAWGGRGVKATGAARRRKFVKTIAGLDPSKRKDAKTEHVIINERKDKKAERYKAKDLPYPYTSAAQYELAMRNPVGPEWNTVTQHQRLALPKVVVKPGKIIKPLERKF